MGPNSTRLRKCGSNHSVNLLDESSMFCAQAVLAKSSRHSSPGCGRTRSADYRERIMPHFCYNAVGLCGLAPIRIWHITLLG
jgi:hypothetical protein